MDFAILGRGGKSAAEHGGGDAFMVGGFIQHLLFYRCDVLPDGGKLGGRLIRATSLSVTVVGFIWPAPGFCVLCTCFLSPLCANRIVHLLPSAPQLFALLCGTNAIN